MSETKKLTRKEKKDLKFAERPLKSYSGFYVYIRSMLSFRTVGYAWHFVREVIINYLLVQFKQKWGFTKLPVVSVDHPLDKKIPFTPAKVTVYMDFVYLFLRPLSMMIQRYGMKKAAKYCREWYTICARTYHESGLMYKHTLSTTERPHYTENFHFKIIHLFDPHLLCVPSLHISLICLCFSYYKKAFKELGLSDAENFQKNTELYNDAVEIAESVLYMKQHSVNCVPAALYMITKLFPELFTPNDATNFINDMFLTAETISTEDCLAIKEHISFMYERFLLEGYAADDWRDPVIRWINEYNKDAEMAKVALKEATLN